MTWMPTTSMISGRATPDGTHRFAARSAAGAGHFRDARGLALSSLGLGTYLGRQDSRTDAGYEEAFEEALSLAINVFDSAINYRGQRSERAIGRAVARAIADGRASREELFIATKGGYFPHDAEDGRDPRSYVRQEFIESGLAPREEISGGAHCMAPGYLADQIERSRRNLGLETIDLYYLHNIETQSAALTRARFRERLVAAIEALEKAVETGRIASWGLATWDGLRAPPEHPDHLGLEETIAAAREVAGEAHHFAAVQLPVNVVMAQAIAYPSQTVGGERLPALPAARALGLAAFGSASILQGRLAEDYSEEFAAAFPEGQTPAQRALQFSRSAPGMTASLVGASSREHAREDFGLSRTPPAAESVVLSFFEG
jgi:aryl-alcohol dehydrogenase-like predicted oxidoreductase